MLGLNDPVCMCCIVCGDVFDSDEIDGDGVCIYCNDEEGEHEARDRDYRSYNAD